MVPYYMTKPKKIKSIIIFFFLFFFVLLVKKHYYLVSIFPCNYRISKVGLEFRIGISTPKKKILELEFMTSREFFFVVVENNGF